MPSIKLAKLLSGSDFSAFFLGVNEIMFINAVISHNAFPLARPWSKTQKNHSLATWMHMGKWEKRNLLKEEEGIRKHEGKTNIAPFSNIRHSIRKTGHWFWNSSDAALSKKRTTPWLLQLGTKCHLPLLWTCWINSSESNGNEKTRETFKRHWGQVSM